MLKVLVTGGAGFIGSNLVEKLLELGHDVISIDNESSQSNEVFYWAEKSSNYKLDICDYDRIRPLFEDVDIVYHLAAEARIQPSLNNPILTAKTNSLGTCTILQCAREAGVKRVIYSSTSSAYGRKNGIPSVETMKKDCLTPYSVTKTCGEELCKMFTDLFGLETVVFRYFNVYGERQPIKGQYAPVIGIFLKQKKDGLPMTIVGDGLQRRDFTHVSDVVEANLLASNLKNKNISGELFNIGTGRNYSIIDIKDMIGTEFTNLPKRIGEAQETLADITKAKKMLDWSPKVVLEDWITNNK